METNDGIPMSEEEEIFFNRLMWDEKHNYPYGHPHCADLRDVRTSNRMQSQELGNACTQGHVQENRIKEYPHANVLLDFHINWNNHWVQAGVILAGASALLGGYIIVRNAFLFVKWILGVL